MSRDVCDNCDALVATDADLDCADCDDSPSECCPKCTALCWRNFHPCCQRPAVNWRSRALAAERRVAQLEAALRTIAATLTDEKRERHNAGEFVSSRLVGAIDECRAALERKT